VLAPLVEKAGARLSRIAEGDVGAERVRKARSALKRVEVVVRALGCGFEARRAAKLMKKTKRLRKGAGRVRDLDVAMDAVEALCVGGDDATQKAGRVVVRALGARRKRRAKKFRAKGMEGAGEIRGRFENMIAAPVRVRAELPSRCATAVVLARESEQMLAAARSDLESVAALHSLRLGLKEARSILELLHAPGASELVARLKDLSAALGAANDLAILTAMLERMERKGPRASRGGAALMRTVATQAHATAHSRAAAMIKVEVPALAVAIRRVAFGGRGDAAGGGMRRKKIARRRERRAMGRVSG
jgi:CHAD domain-containing protein